MKKILLFLFLLSSLCNAQQMPVPYNTPINWGNPFTQGLVATFPIIEGGGKYAIDATGFTSGNGTFNSSGAPYSNKQLGQCGNMANSSAINVTAGTTTTSSLSSPATYGSISAWINLNSTALNKGIVSKGDAATNDRNGYTMWVNGTGNLVLEVCSASGFTALTGTATMSINTWYHVVATWNSTTITTYINGRQDNTAANSTVAVSNVFTFLIGGFRNSSNAITLPFNGYIQNVMVWNRCLSYTEVSQFYTNPWCIYKNYQY